MCSSASTDNVFLFRSDRELVNKLSSTDNVLKMEWKPEPLSPVCAGRSSLDMFFRRSLWALLSGAPGSKFSRAQVRHRHWLASAHYFSIRADLDFKESDNKERTYHLLRAKLPVHEHIADELSEFQVSNCAMET